MYIILEHDDEGEEISLDDIDFDDTVFDENDTGLIMSSSSSENAVDIREPNLPKGNGVSLTGS